ncbi:putative protein phosphatase 2C 22 [Hibiscus syriacus]|uniref:PPM-type phosphatase domain-containing protein n=1 Tax=Hibiscus syriacus TaxID=106335 RepID=A0A6A3BEM3_HIBSY|nr:putative protein phosphatase 2C 22 [Hibiscus syriacus]
MVESKALDIAIGSGHEVENHGAKFIPIVRSAAWAGIGFRTSMEYVYVCVDDFMHDYGLKNFADEPSAFYGLFRRFGASLHDLTCKRKEKYLGDDLGLYKVFDGHGGKHAANFACNHLPRFIVEDEDFPGEIERVVASAFLQIDTAFAEACSSDSTLASGAPALVALVLGRMLVVANAGDCRAVLCRRGKAIEMSRDHKPMCNRERRRIEACGGSVYDGYLNGQLNVARALGDWHMEGNKGCDGLWDVFLSQDAVDFARRRLQEHNDPAMCSKDLVDEALKRRSVDNLIVVVVCLESNPPPNLILPRARVQRSFSAEGLRELQSFLDSLGN